MSSGTNFAFSFAYGFIFAFFSIFLGIVAIKKIKNYREQIAHTGFATAGILFGSIAGLTMFTGIF